MVTEENGQKKHSAQRQLSATFNSSLYHFWCLVAPALCSLNIFILFPNYLSAQKLLPTWSVINYCLLIRQLGDKSMSNFVSTRLRIFPL